MKATTVVIVLLAVGFAAALFFMFAYKHDLNLLQQGLAQQQQADEAAINAKLS